MSTIEDDVGEEREDLSTQSLGEILEEFYTYHEENDQRKDSKGADHGRDQRNPGHPRRTRLFARRRLFFRRRLFRPVFPRTGAGGRRRLFLEIVGEARLDVVHKVGDVKLDGGEERAEGVRDGDAGEAAQGGGQHQHQTDHDAFFVFVGVGEGVLWLVFFVVNRFRRIERNWC